MSQPDLILFAKQPLPGKVKTRLQPHYSPEQAAEISSFLIRATVELAVSAWPGDVYLYAAPGPEHPLFHALAEEFHIHLAAQAEGDLGYKMLSALREGIERQGCAAVMGCDVPHCPWNVIDQANDWLVRGRNVLGPALDGGYYFIGMHEARPELFEAIEWGSGQVAETTLARAAQAGIEFEMLPRMRDLDTPEDLWSIGQTFLPIQRYLRK